MTTRRKGEDLNRPMGITFAAGIRRLVKAKPFEAVAVVETADDSSPNSTVTFATTMSMRSIGRLSHLAPASDANFTARDKQQLANPPYRQAWIPPTYQRQIVQYHQKEGPGSVVVDTSARHVYYVLPGGKAVRYGAIVGEYGQAWSGVATVGRKEEWPGWTPTEGEKRRLGPLPNYVEGGAHNPMGARALYLYAGGKDTLYRIHGTNQHVYS